MDSFLREGRACPELVEGVSSIHFPLRHGSKGPVLSAVEGTCPERSRRNNLKYTDRLHVEKTLSNSSPSPIS